MSSAMNICGFKSPRIFRLNNEDLGNIYNKITHKIDFKRRKFAVIVVARIIHKL